MTAAAEVAAHEFQTIRYEQKGAVGVITLDRPKCLNAIDFAMRDELTACLRAPASHLDTRVILLTGAGRAFSAGLDLKEPAIAGGGPMTPKRAYEAQRTYSQMILDMRRIPHRHCQRHRLFLNLWRQLTDNPLGKKCRRTWASMGEPSS